MMKGRIMKPGLDHKETTIRSRRTAAMDGNITNPAKIKADLGQIQPNSAWLRSA